MISTSPDLSKVGNSLMGAWLDELLVELLIPACDLGNRCVSLYVSRSRCRDARMVELRDVLATEGAREWERECCRGGSVARPRSSGCETMVRNTWMRFGTLINGLRSRNYDGKKSSGAYPRSKAQHYSVQRCGRGVVARYNITETPLDQFQAWCFSNLRNAIDPKPGLR